MNLFSVSSCGIKTISDWDPRRWHNKRVLALGIGQAVLQGNGLKEKLKYEYYKKTRSGHRILTIVSIAFLEMHLENCQEMQISKQAKKKKQQNKNSYVILLARQSVWRYKLTKSAGKRTVSGRQWEKKKLVRPKIHGKIINSRKAKTRCPVVECVDAPPTTYLIFLVSLVSIWFITLLPSLYL